MKEHIELLKAISCYGHLGGTLGNRMFSRMVEAGWFTAEEENPKKFRITELGIQELLKLGIDPYKRRTN